MTGPEKIVDNIIQSRAGGTVERCHGIPHHGSYSNASHSWGVAMLMHYLYPEDFPHLGAVCLAHDVPEGWTGDIPAPVLRYFPRVKQELAPVEAKLCRSLGLPVEDELSASDYDKLKVCDRLEFYLWCRGQVDRGNSLVNAALLEITKYLDQSILPPPARDVWIHLRTTSTLPRQAGVMEAMAKEISDGEL